MAQPGDGSVTVRVEVTVTGRQVEVKRPGKIIPRKIVLPQPTDTKVRQTAAGSGNICARGTNPGTGTDLRVVWAKVYQAVFDLDYAYTNYWRPDAGALSVAPDDDDGSWRFELSTGNELPGAACDNNAGGAPNNTLVVWYDFRDLDDYVIELVNFHGLCSTGTDCDPGGSGTGLAPSLPLGMQSVARLPPAPLQWRITVEGFGTGPLKACNGTWALVLTQDTGNACVWDNGYDGRTDPRIELRCDSPVPLQWQLTFQHNDVTVRYVKPASEWRPLQPNTFTQRLQPTGRAGRRFPHSVTVEPA
jgi:hypothetical protein